MMKSAVVIVVEIVVYGLGGFMKVQQSLRSSAFEFNRPINGQIFAPEVTCAQRARHRLGRTVTHCLVSVIRIFRETSGSKTAA